jgi:hypothetical protein
MIGETFKLLNDKLAIDKEAGEIGDVLNNAIADGQITPDTKPLPLYVIINRTDPPEYEGRSTKSLSMLLRRKKPEDGSRDGATDSMIKVYLPAPEGYHYPDQIDEDNMPPEMYIEFIPSEGSRDLYARYIIQQDETDFPKFRYSIYTYEINPNTGEHEIYDAMHSEVIHEGVMDRIPADIERAGKLIRRLANFDAVPQRTTYVKIERENTIQLPE